MFETSISAEISCPPIFGLDLRLWSYVHLSLHIPWFHVEYEICDINDQYLRQILFLSDIEQLLNLQEEQGSMIVQVDLVSPACVNQQGCWKMEPLCEIWTGVEPKSGQESTVFVVKSGARYVDSNLSESDLGAFQCVFHST